MSKTLLYNLNNSEFINSSDNVYIGRGTKWGNPYIVDVHGSRTEVISKYEEYLRAKLINGSIKVNELLDLSDKKLYCHCVPKRCHGEVILKLIDEYKLDEL